MKQLLSPKQVARAIGVSESSLKRWCDQGRIPTTRTAGGHRRLPISGVLEFLRASRYELVEPEVLGLPSTTGQGPRVLDRAAEGLADALVAGNEPLARQIVIDLYLAEHRLSSICDRVIGPAFYRVGECWDCGQIEIYRERRSCEICERLIHELRSAVPPVEKQAPLALGGTPVGDPYRLPTMLVELVLRENGWDATSLGTSLPFDTLRAAVVQNRPRLFWLSVTSFSDTDAFLADYQRFYDEFGDQIAIVVGGQAITSPLRRKMQYAAFCDTMQHLESFVSSLDTSPR
ncbi:MAG: helix-turn-helix domain-containing protein [Planctomycetales bacterium]|nr:helix-turn-helix domain-containing protein [Planctomycetales bacterium]